MSFDGPALSFDDEGSILFDGENIIVTVPVGHEALDHLGAEKDIPFPVVYTHPSHAQNQQPSPDMPPTNNHIFNPILNKEKAIEHNERARRERKQTDRVFVAGATGLSAALSLPDYVVPEENLRNIGGPGGSLRDPRNPVEMEAYLAARRNPLLHEVLIFIEDDGIPPELQGDVAGILKLFGENGIDDADTREAERYLIYKMYGSSANVHHVDALNEAWAEAHEVFNPALGDGNNEKQAIVDYRSLIETTYGVTLKRDSKANTWDLLRLRILHVGLEMAAAAFGEFMRSNGYYWDDATAFRRIIGDIDIYLSRDTSDRGALAQVENRRIKIFWTERKDGDRNAYLIPDVLLHELGHIFNANAGFGDRKGEGSINKTEEHPNTWTGMGSPYPATLAPENKPEGSVKFGSGMEDIRPLHDILELDEDDKLFSGVTLTKDQILLLRQSWAKGDTNEITADGFLNWVFHRITGGAIGFTDSAEGKDWQMFMNDNMDTWVQNAIVHNAMQTGDSTFVSEIAGFPEVFGSGTVRAEKGLRVRTTPVVEDGNRLPSSQQGEKLLILGRSKDNLWITTAKNGVLAWMYYGSPSNPMITLPEGVNIEDLPPYDGHATLNLDLSF